MSIQKRTWSEGKRPRYIARIRVGGKQRSKSFATLREARDWEQEQQGRKPAGSRTDNKIMSVAVESWSDQADGSTGVGRKHLHSNLGPLADMKVGNVDTDDVRAWRRVLVEGRPWADGQPFKSSTVSTLTRHLSAFFNDLVSRDQIARNPVLGARSGAGRVDGTAEVVDPAKLMTTDEVGALIRSADDDSVSVALELIATTGLRPNEMAGLRVNSVDFDAGTLHVQEQAAGLYGDWAWKPLKSVKARRSIPLPSSTVARLREHVEAHPDYAPGTPLFRTERGYQWSSAHFYRAFSKAADKAGVTGQSPKSLRHFYASRLIRAGESVAVVQARLGHASPMVTLSVYTHLWEDAGDTTRAAVEGLF
ncbi:tyrosine-type recombinase/integrase [Williamsia deligens]|uniref:Tyrosine-type recombinase/integrase n=1 Tax=Williamsia deligens TaxID=321325 RepID=A0ABW3GEA3_9NOCA|nr:site-specific integrase [Williamsia deligens]MCP2195623.1 Site-specific recombinase XerD [Williamsia deligens]